MDQVTQQNAAMVEEANAATQKLSEEANHLAALIQHFHLEKNAELAAASIAQPQSKSNRAA